MKGFTLIELAIVIVIAALLAAVAVPIYNGIVRDSKWSEAKTAVGTIKAAVDPYYAKTQGDLGDLNSGAPMTDAGNLALLKLDPAAFDSLQYFFATNFVLNIVPGAVGPPVVPDTYTIVVGPVLAGGGQSGNGPDGQCTYDSSVGTYTLDLQ